MKLSFQKYCKLSRTVCSPCKNEWADYVERQQQIVNKRKITGAEGAIHQWNKQ